jgi:hypothetical protein
MWLGGRPSCLECERANLCRIREYFGARKGYSVVLKICYGQVHGLPGLICSRVTKMPLPPFPRHVRRSPTADAAVGVCASGTKILRRGRRAHYVFLRASCLLSLVVEWRLVALCGPSMERSCVLNWPWYLVLLRKRLPPFHERQLCEHNRKGALGC